MHVSVVNQQKDAIKRRKFKVPRINILANVKSQVALRSASLKLDLHITKKLLELFQKY